MKNIRAVLSVFILLLVTSLAMAWESGEKPRIIVLTDIENEPDDAQSLVRFQFADGEVIEGNVYAIGPAGEQRVQDIVNRGDMFLHVDTGSGLFLVNITLVSSVKVMEVPSAGP